jgi:hypothetical protein
MSRLYFTPVDKAFTLGSSQIKETQEEIDNLTKLILESNTQTSKKKKSAPETPLQTPATSDYQRIGMPDRQNAVFRPNTAQDDINYNLMKVVGHPRFDDVVKNYVLINHPEWLLKESVYVPQQPKSTFGNKYQTTVCLEVQRYVTFFIISVIIFVLLTILL